MAETNTTRISPERINLAREWLATIESVPPGDLGIVQDIIDTIEEALEIAMEASLQAPISDKPWARFRNVDELKRWYEAQLDDPDYKAAVERVGK